MSHINPINVDITAQISKSYLRLRMINHKAMRIKIFKSPWVSNNFLMFNMKFVVLLIFSEIMYVKFLTFMFMIEVFGFVDGKSCNDQAKAFRKKNGKAGNKSEDDLCCNNLIISI